jgi:hypothetical protein
MKGSSLPGLTRQSIVFGKMLCEDGWIRGSSPRMTQRDASVSLSVIAQLDPAIHLLRKDAFAKMDGYAGQARV